MRVADCPFCNGRSRMREDATCKRMGDGWVGRYIQCDKCMAKSKTFKGRFTGGNIKAFVNRIEYETVEAWNRRDGIR